MCKQPTLDGVHPGVGRPQPMTGGPITLLLEGADVTRLNSVARAHQGGAADPPMTGLALLLSLGDPTCHGASLVVMVAFGFGMDP